MKRLTTALIAASLATAALASGERQEAQVSGSEKPKAIAENIHLARTHGLAMGMPQEAQRAGSERAQAAAEDIHLKKDHGRVNTHADELMLQQASRL